MAGTRRKHLEKLQRDIYYRIAVILRVRRRFDLARACFEYVAEDPPAGLSSADIALQLALVEVSRGTRDAAIGLLGELISFLDKLQRPKVSPAPPHLAEPGCRRLRLLQLLARGHLVWLDSEADPAASISALEAVCRELPASEGEERFPDGTIMWCLLGRLLRVHGQPVKAYEAFQQAIYRDSLNAAIWNSVGILYVATQQYRDALEAFSRAIQQAPFVADLWWNLGILYETCSQQLSDAIDAYQRAAELDSASERINARLTLVKGWFGEKQMSDERRRSDPPDPASERTDSTSTLTKSPSAERQRLDLPDFVELDPLQFAQRPLLLNGMQLPAQRPLSALPPAPMRRGN